MTNIAELAVVLTADNSDLNRGMDDADNKVKNFRDSAGSKLKDLSRQAAIAGGAIGVALAGASIKAAMDWESQFANVAKTIDMDPAGLEALNDELREMATSGITGTLENAHEQLANIASVAGQLGVPNANLRDFTETMAMLSVATNLSAEEASVFAARFANVTGMSWDDIDELGDTLVTLGNNMAANEGEIASFAERLSTLSAFGFTPDEILGYSAALASLGVSAELGSTNLRKFAGQMVEAAAVGGPDLDKMAEVAGMTADEFGELVKNNPSDALQAFTDGLGKLDASEQIAALGDLNIEGAEQRDVLLRLAEGQEVVADGLALANEGWENSNALVEEAGTKSETTKGKFEKLKNNLHDLAIEVGDALLPAFNDVVTGFTDMIDGLNDGDIDAAFEGLTNALQPAMDLISDLLGVESVDIGDGLRSLAYGFDMAGKALTIVMDRIRRGIDLFILDVQLKFMDFASGFRDLVLEATGGQVDIAPNINFDRAGVEAQIRSMGMADQLTAAINGAINDGVNIGEVLTGTSFIDSEGYEGFDLAHLLTFNTDNIAQGVGSEARVAIEDGLRQAFTTGDEAAVEMLLPLAAQLDIDVDAIQAQTQVTDQVEGLQYDAAIAADLTVAAGYIDTTMFEAAVAAAVGAAGNAAVGRSGAQYAAMAGAYASGAIPGGNVYGPQPQGATTNINVTAFGSNTRDVLEMTRRAARDEGYFG